MENLTESNSDIQFDPMDLYAGCEHVKSVNQKLDTLSNTISAVTLNVELSTAPLLDDAKNVVSSMINEADEINSKVTNVRNAYLNANPELEVLFAEYDASLSMLSMSENDEFNYITLISELISANKNAAIYSGDVSKLYDTYDENGQRVAGSGMNYINEQLDGVLMTYTGREAAVNSALMALKLAADKGVKYCYRHEGSNMTSVPYNTNEQLVSGMDCCEFVSWAINKGSTEPFHWQGVSGLSTMGQKIDYVEAQPGDIFVKYNSDGSGHVGMIIANDLEQESFIIAEAKGFDEDIILDEITYSYLKQRGYQINSYKEYYESTISSVE